MKQKFEKVEIFSGFQIQRLCLSQEHSHKNVKKANKALGSVCRAIISILERIATKYL